MIHGLINYGSSWARARNALAYHYKSLPIALIVRVLAPGRMQVYQGEHSIGSIQAGAVDVGGLQLGVLDLFGAYPLFKEGHGILRQDIHEPVHEHPRDWHEFEWLAFVNVVLAIVNNIQLRGHGGALIFASKNSGVVDDGFVKIKYGLSARSNHLKRHFTEFMTERHKLGDMVHLMDYEDERPPAEDAVRLQEFIVRERQERLSETVSLVAGLSGTDGAVILRTDLTLDGFGAEILLDKTKPVTVRKVIEPIRKRSVTLDSEQYGMRHRSAMRLCSAVPDLVVFVVSQDGGVSLIWNEDGDTYFRPGIRTTNSNMVLA